MKKSIFGIVRHQRMSQENVEQKFPVQLWKNNGNYEGNVLCTWDMSLHRKTSIILNLLLHYLNEQTNEVLAWNNRLDTKRCTSSRAQRFATAATITTVLVSLESSSVWQSISSLPLPPSGKFSHHSQGEEVKCPERTQPRVSTGQWLVNQAHVGRHAPTTGRWAHILSRFTAPPLRVLSRASSAPWASCPWKHCAVSLQSALAHLRFPGTFHRRY